ncbi:MAG TPA: general stress protein, partial [Allocoleopsis sp.]
MVVGRHKRAVGVFSHRRDVEAALRELRDSGFPMDKVSVITRDADREDIAGADVRDEHGRDVHGNVADRTKADEGA